MESKENTYEGRNIVEEIFLPIKEIDERQKSKKALKKKEADDAIERLNMEIEQSKKVHKI